MLKALKDPIYCGRDKGMPNGWSLNWENMARRGKGRTQRHVW